MIDPVTGKFTQPIWRRRRVALYASGPLFENEPLQRALFQFSQAAILAFEPLA